jgi:stage II sporulation protein D
MRKAFVAVVLAVGLALGLALALKLKSDPVTGRVRVLISAQFGNLGFSDLYLFPEVTLQAVGSSLIVRRDGTEYAQAALPGRPLKFTVQDGKLKLEYAGSSVDLGQKATLAPLEPKDEDTLRYKLLSTKRGQVNPEYPGLLELSVRDGKIAVVNDVSLESYLMRVVPSEMPDTFHPEALEAQAVAARTYAVSRILAPPENNKWKAWNADVDDSVAEQVYNNIPTAATTDAAVNATRGQVLLYGNDPITTNYASTTAGWSANIQEVWPDKNPVPYLISRPQTQPEQTAPQDEAGWLAFFKSRDATGFFDAASSLWRWKVTMTAQELEAIISKALPERLKALPEFTKTLEGTAPDAPNFSIGTLQGLKLVTRAAGGYVVALEVAGSNGRWQVERESQIRFLLRPTKTYSGKDTDIILERGNGKTTANFSSLPSASFSWEEERDAAGALMRVTLYGGGFGHGVGMSQFGADGMGKLGFTSDQILAHFYPGTELKTLYP